MAGPVLYEVTVPFFRKALQNQVQILKRAEAWCTETSHPSSKLISATLGSDSSAIPFHVQFCIYNAVQALIDLNISTVESPSIQCEELSMDNLIARIEAALELLHQAAPESFAGKESGTVQVNLGSFSIDRTVMEYAHEISLPSFWFHHSMIYAILRAEGVPLTKQLFLSAW